jgi:phenylpropionate dioxygenase-like ring-hydroxylating dioxygenase large terminal subunit
MLDAPPAAVPDFPALRACWHPVGYAREFAGEPRRVRLLGEDVAVWRDSGGTPHALRDLCIHRGTALSLGRVVGDRLMCPYHGWQNSDSSRQLENFTDFGHFPWVHPGLLGDPERPVVPEHTVRIDGHVLRYDIVRPEAPNSDDFPVFGNEVVERPERRSRYHLQLPYTILLRLGWGGEAGMVYFFASQPVDEERCTGYLMIARNYDLDQPPQVLRDFEDTIFNQDRHVVESQRPERVPFDLAAEMHLTFDAVAIAYRRAMREQGLARRPAATAA